MFLSLRCTASACCRRPRPVGLGWASGTCRARCLATASLGGGEPAAAWEQQRHPPEAEFVPPQLRTTRNREEQRRRRASSFPPRGASGSTAPLLRPEVSPKRKHYHGPRLVSKLRKQRHTHGTDLRDLEREEEGEAAGPGLPRGAQLGAAPGTGTAEPPAVPPRGRFVRKLVTRSVAALPRTPQQLLAFGRPMQAEDLTHDAPSVFVESRRLIDDVLERRQAMQASPDHVAPDTPFWRLPAKLRNKRPVKWQEAEEEEEEEGDPRDGGGGSSASSALVVTTKNGTRGGNEQSEQAASSVADAIADQLRGITDLSRPGTRAQSLAPSHRAAELAAAEEEGTAGVGGGGSAVAADEGGGATEGAGPRSLGRRDPGRNLVASLRQQAAEFAATGVNPDVKRSLEEALRHHPGSERAARLQEMSACRHDFESLVLEGRASVATLNELIRAQGHQGRMDAAMRTHDTMKLHGYEPDEETFVSLLLGAVKARDPELARRLFLKMREQMISPTVKVYAALMQAHVAGGDVASAFSLLQKMEDEQITPDLVCHTVAINGLVNHGYLEKAWEEFHSIRTWKLIRPDEVLFTVMIKACAKAGEPERALNMLDDLRISGLYPTDFTYGELISAMATTPDFAHKAFDFFRHMQAEDLPIGPFVFEKLLLACKSLGDPRRARKVVEEMRQSGLALEPAMYCHLVGVFATAMRLPQVTEGEKLQNLRAAWHVVAEARRCCGPERLEWTPLLNEVLGVYCAGGFARFAVEMLPQYAVLGATPDSGTYQLLLELLGRRLKDAGRFFALWEALPKQPKPADELYHIALEVAMETRSSRRTCKVLDEMYAARVFPTGQLTERLASVGRYVTHIHLLIGKFVELAKRSRGTVVRRETALLRLRMDERATQLALLGQTHKTRNPEQEVRDSFFRKLHQRGHFRRPWLPKGEYLASKAKGGPAYAQRHDRPRPNLLGA